MAAEWDSPFGAAESEAIGELSTERVPERRLLFIFQPEELIVVVLHLLVFLSDIGSVTVFAVLSPAATTTTTTSTAASASASASATLQKLANLDVELEMRDRLENTLNFAILSGMASRNGCVRSCDGRVWAIILRQEI